MSHSTGVSISVVIVSYNVAGLVAECLRSLQRELDGINAEVFVVDNASADGTVDNIREHFPWVKLHACRENLWFPRGNNRVLPECRGRFVLLLNPDTYVHQGALRSLIHYMDEHPMVGAVGPTLRLANGEIQPECARNLPTPLRLLPWAFQADKTAVSLVRRLRQSSFVRRQLEALLGRTVDKYAQLLAARTENASVECISGACMLIRGELIDEIGLLDDTLVFYLEDIDYCQRILDAGWEIHHVADCTVTHHWQRSSTQARREGELYAMVCHAIWVFLRRYRGTRAAAAFVGISAAASVVRIAVSSVAVLLTREERREFWRRQLAMATGMGKWVMSDKSRPPLP